MKTGLSEADTKKVFQILMDQLDVQEDQLTDDARIQEDLGADSLDIIEIVMKTEEQFELTIPDEMAERVTTVGALLETLAEMLEKQKSD
jgi:acyl carrier protein